MILRAVALLGPILGLVPVHADATPPPVTVVTTANIRVDLPLPKARVDLAYAAQGSDVVLTQEMAGRDARKIAPHGYATYQPGGPYMCGENAVYWRTTRFTPVARTYQVLAVGPVGLPARTRCVTIVRLRDQRTGKTSRYLDTHLYPHVEKGGHPRNLPRVQVYARAMRHLSAIIGRSRIDTTVGGDWNVDWFADRRVRWHGFPYAHLNRRFDANWQYHRGTGSLGTRRVDTVWFDHTRFLWSRTLPRTWSDHRFVRVALH